MREPLSFNVRSRPRSPPRHSPNTLFPLPTAALPILHASGEAIVNGKAFVSETSVEELKHYAEDAGKSKEEIEAITEPKRTYGFLADGVLLKG